MRRTRAHQDALRELSVLRARDAGLTGRVADLERKLDEQDARARVLEGLILRALARQTR